MSSEAYFVSLLETGGLHSRVLVWRHLHTWSRHRSEDVVYLADELLVSRVDHTRQKWHALVGAHGDDFTFTCVGDFSDLHNLLRWSLRSEAATASSATPEAATTSVTTSESTAASSSETHL